MIPNIGDCIFVPMLHIQSPASIRYTRHIFPSLSSAVFLDAAAPVVGNNQRAGNHSLIIKLVFCYNRYLSLPILRTHYKLASSTAVYVEFYLYGIGHDSSWLTNKKILRICIFLHCTVFITGGP